MARLSQGCGNATCMWQGCMYMASEFVGVYSIQSKVVRGLWLCTSEKQAPLHEMDMSILYTHECKCYNINVLCMYTVSRLYSLECITGCDKLRISCSLLYSSLEVSVSLLIPSFTLLTATAKSKGISLV